MQWLLISSVFVLAAGVQGITGAGYALVAAPILLIVAPHLVPVPLLLIEFTLMIAMVLRERFAIDLRALTGALLASLPGAAAGVAVLVVWPTRLVTLLIAAAVIVSSTLALSGHTVPTTKWTMVGAGFGAGAMNSIAGMPGPPIALVYRPADPAALRTNLSLSYLVMSIFSVTLLYAQGIGTWHSLVTAIQYVPAVIIGFAGARTCVSRVRGALIGRAVLWLTLSSGLFLLIRSIIG